MRRLIGLIAGTLLMGTVAAEQIAPDTLVKNVTDDVLNIISHDLEILGGDTAKAIALVEAKLLTDFDFKRMTALAMGKEWRQATLDQQLTLTTEFRTLLVHTYSRALTAYKNQTINFKPSKIADDDTDVTVRTEIKQPGAKSVSIDYAMEKSNSTWKVYDITVSGISLVLSFRDQFGQEVHNGGIDGLIKTLQVKNGSRISA
ncbi:MAG: ABC transporter substrate-binding protein [Georgfuchsia sp.]